MRTYGNPGTEALIQTGLVTTKKGTKISSGSPPLGVIISHGTCASSRTLNPSSFLYPFIRAYYLWSLLYPVGSPITLLRH